MSNGAHTSPSPPIPLRTIRPPPSREDYWSEEATHTLIESWGARYLELGRGHLRQNHWDEVAAAVNAVHGQTKRTRRTDVQCKNRIDTIKKKYKIEKARDVASKGDYVSPWPFFPRLDSIIGGTTTKKNKISPPPPPPPTTMMVRRRSPNTPALGLLAPIPVAPRSKRPITVLAPENSFLRRHISAVAVAAAATDETESDSSDSESEGRGKRERDEDEEEEGEERGCRELAEAIARFGEVYERVEVMKQEKLMELEKQRMRFAMDLEFQRMKLLTDIHVQMAKVKRAKSTTTGDADADDDDGGEQMRGLNSWFVIAWFCCL